MAEPLVSILVPTYRGARWVGETLSTALAQTYPHCEIVVSDDASPDETLDVVRSVVGRDPRVRLLSGRTNCGAAVNFERVLRAAQGEYVKYLNQDDLLHPTCVERLVEPLVADPTITLSTSKRALVDDAGARLPDIPATTSIVDAEGRITGRDLIDFVLRHNCNVIGEPTTVMFRRADVQPDDLWRFGQHHFEVNADLALWLRLLSIGDAYYVVDELSSFRWHDAQRTQRTGMRHAGLAEWLDLVEQAHALGFLNDPEAAAQARRTAEANVREAGGGGPEGVGHTVAPDASRRPARAGTIVIYAGDDVATTADTLVALAEETGDDEYAVIVVDDGLAPEMGGLLDGLDGDVVVITNPTPIGEDASLRLGAQVAATSVVVALGSGRA